MRYFDVDGNEIKDPDKMNEDLNRTIRAGEKGNQPVNPPSEVYGGDPAFASEHIAAMNKDRAAQAKIDAANIRKQMLAQYLRSTIGNREAEQRADGGIAGDKPAPKEFKDLTPTEIVGKATSFDTRSPEHTQRLLQMQKLKDYLKANTKYADGGITKKAPTAKEMADYESGSGEDRIWVEDPSVLIPSEEELAAEDMANTDESADIMRKASNAPQRVKDLDMVEDFADQPMAQRAMRRSLGEKEPIGPSVERTAADRWEDSRDFFRREDAKPMNKLRKYLNMMRYKLTGEDQDPPH